MGNCDDGEAGRVGRLLGGTDGRLTEAVGGLIS